MYSKQDNMFVALKMKMRVCLKQFKVFGLNCFEDKYKIGAEFQYKYVLNNFCLNLILRALN